MKIIKNKLSKYSKTWLIIEELTPSKLSSHKIHLKANEKPVKLRGYWLIKLK